MGKSSKSPGKSSKSPGKPSKSPSKSSKKSDPESVVFRSTTRELIGDLVPARRCEAEEEVAESGEESDESETRQARDQGSCQGIAEGRKGTRFDCGQHFPN
ncbi:hypothetical protein AYI68_g2143 [Smittium mucronatum]|uniref:Uncharacterized protein n=1 Tax=Smittium mucronatum TaxID=133383 RepID=A0A1R0H3J0_9FUNG|nr:hypothetical protein AYI68_g2143 [Smittium mucronatum]